MATANKTMSATKVVIPCRISFANIFEPKSINGGDAKYSVSCLIPKADKKTLLAIHKAMEAAKEDGKTRKWGGKIPPNLKMPLRDGDIDRPDDENYQEHFFLNATSKDAPQVVDRHVQPVTDPMMVTPAATAMSASTSTPSTPTAIVAWRLVWATSSSSRMATACLVVPLRMQTSMHWRMTRKSSATTPVKNCPTTCAKYTSTGRELRLPPFLHDRSR